MAPPKWVWQGKEVLHLYEIPSIIWKDGALCGHKAFRFPQSYSSVSPFYLVTKMENEKVTPCDVCIEALYDRYL